MNTTANYKSDKLQKGDVFRFVGAKVSHQVILRTNSYVHALSLEANEKMIRIALDGQPVTVALQPSKPMH